MKLFFLITIFSFPLFASDIKPCRTFKSESDCKYNESNNCTWIIGQQRCVSKRGGNTGYYSNNKRIKSNKGIKHHNGGRKNGPGHNGGGGRRGRR